MRSGKLKATNDQLIRELLLDSRFDIRANGTIWYLKTGQWKMAGRKDKEGYIEVYYAGKRLKAHRIVYAKYKGRLFSDLVIDHGNANPGHNHPENLELCGQRKNNIYVARRMERTIHGKRKR